MKPRTGIFIKGGLLTAACLTGIFLSETILRNAQGVTAYTPSPQVLAVQQYSTLHPKLGFLWMPNIPLSRNLHLAWKDAAPDPLATDRWGFRNSPEATAWLQSGKPVDIVGIGDSFLDWYALSLHDFFHQKGFFYYSMAMHSYCPAQYNIVLEDYALPLKPRRILYALFENDFVETREFEAWRVSHTDWFTYHSGTWCGPRKNPYFPYLGRLADRIATNVRRRESSTDPVLHCIVQAQKLADEQGAQMLVVFIPSKETVLHKKGSMAGAYDRLAPALRSRNVAFLDLRTVFARVPNPGTLYYATDSHWNRTGMTLAADAFAKAFSS